MTLTTESAEEAAAPIMQFRLYVAGDGPNSRRAIGNLRAIGQDRLHGRYSVEIIDVLEAPLRALDDGVLLTPTLIKVAPPPRCQLVGDLSAQETVMLALGID